MKGAVSAGCCCWKITNESWSIPLWRQLHSECLPLFFLVYLFTMCAPQGVWSSPRKEIVSYSSVIPTSYIGSST
jgi:hypothetical protein